ncbi:MAG: peptidylprolyl isomerase [Burkholderiaceae bacterium]|nr:peptidylprolyl isomerase [Roseateles sp.]MBV8469698.1 peptidylprolyl isomerase [Burkholderiaceae bacterium]
MASFRFKRSLQFWLSASAVVGSAALVSACGGGSSGGSSSSSAPSYGGGLTPGSVTLTITHHVTLTTNFGKIVVGLDGTHAPLSTANFLAYVNANFYNGTLFHRVVPGFVAQGGGYIDNNGTYQLQGPLQAAIALESRNGLSNTQYTIAMARTSDPNSATSQFYFNLVNNASSLDYPSSDHAGYAVFGTVSPTDSTSIATLTAISAVTTGTNSQTGQSNWPSSDVVITSAVQTD